MLINMLIISPTSSALQISINSTLQVQRPASKQGSDGYLRWKLRPPLKNLG